MLYELDRCVVCVRSMFDMCWIDMLYVLVRCVICVRSMCNMCWIDMLYVLHRCVECVGSMCDMCWIDVWYVLDECFSFGVIYSLYLLQIRRCAQCQLRKVHRLPRQKLHPITAQSPYSHLQLDLIELLVTPRQNRYVGVLEDIFSKFVWVQPMATKEATNVVAFLKEIVRVNGSFDILQTDHGSEFVNSAVTAFAEENKIGW